MNIKDPDRSNNGIDTWFKYEENINSITICGRTLIRAPILRVLAVLSEVDLMSRSVDHFEEIKRIQNYSIFRWLLRIGIKMPPTFTNREVYAIGFGTIVPDTNTIIMPFRSINDKYYGFVTPPEGPDYKRIEIIFGFFHIKYIDEEYCELSNCYNVDPKISIIPTFILNTFIKELSYYVLNDLRTQIENADPIYDERIKANPHYYGKAQSILIKDLNK